jgi:hypothetical protein
MEFLRAGPNIWISRNNAYVIQRVGPKKWALHGGHGNVLIVLDSKAACEQHANELEGR